jgi:hypothetical protein
MSYEDKEAIISEINAVIDQTCNDVINAVDGLKALYVLMSIVDSSLIVNDTNHISYAALLRALNLILSSLKDFTDANINFVVPELSKYAKP